MKSIVNEKVEHVKYGGGKIISEESGKIVVEFKNDITKKMFLFPDAFYEFLKFDNKTLQEEYVKLAQDKKKRLDEEAEEQRQETQRQEDELRREKAELTKKKKKAPSKAKPKAAPKAKIAKPVDEE